MRGPYTLRINVKSIRACRLNVIFCSSLVVVKDEVCHIVTVSVAQLFQQKMLQVQLSCVACFLVFDDVIMRHLHTPVSSSRLLHLSLSINVTSRLYTSPEVYFYRDEKTYAGRMSCTSSILYGVSLNGCWQNHRRYTEANKRQTHRYFDTLEVFAVTPCIALPVSHCHLQVNLSRLLLQCNFQ